MKEKIAEHIDNVEIEYIPTTIYSSFLISCFFSALAFLVSHLHSYSYFYILLSTIGQAMWYGIISLLTLSFLTNFPKIKKSNRFFTSFKLTFIVFIIFNCLFFYEFFSTKRLLDIIPSSVLEKMEKINDKKMDNIYFGLYKCSQENWEQIKKKNNISSEGIIYWKHDENFEWLPKWLKNTKGISLSAKITSYELFYKTEKQELLIYYWLHEF